MERRFSLLLVRWDGNFCIANLVDCLSMLTTSMVSGHILWLINQEKVVMNFHRQCFSGQEAGVSGILKNEEFIPHDSALILTCLRALNLSTRLFGTTVTEPSGISPIILAGDPETMEKGGITISGGIVVPDSTTTKSFRIHLKMNTETSLCGERI